MVIFYKSNSANILLVNILLAGLVISGCASKPTTYSNVDSSVNFSQYKTYSFFAELATDKVGYESLESSFLKVAVAQEMDKRGFSYSDSPDLIMNFYINTKEKIRSRSVPTAGAYYDYRDPFYDTWGGYGGYGGYETRIDQYTEGTLNIDVVDAATRKLVWEGAIVGRVTNETIKNLEAVIDSAVHEIFKEFPIQSVVQQ